VSLSANLDPHDVTAAEFIRAFHSASWPGGKLALREKAEREANDEPARRVRYIPASAAEDAGRESIELKCFEDLYGYHGQDARVYELNPWEFIMYWEPVALQKPTTRVPSADDLTEWIEQPEAGEVAKAGVHYKVKEDLAKHPDVVMFPQSAVLQFFRHLWIFATSIPTTCPPARWNADARS
jgi:hypothetical protein